MSHVEATAGILVRLRNQADIAGCIDVLRAVHEVDAYPAVWPNEPSGFLRPEGLIAAWIALSGPAIIGHVVLGAPEECEMQPGTPAVEKAEVKRLFVGPAARGKGVARMLLEIASAYAQTLRLLPILEVTTDGAAAMHLYEKRGLAPDRHESRNMERRVGRASTSLYVRTIVITLCTIRTGLPHSILQSATSLRQSS